VGLDETQLQIEAMRSFAELFQVGIEHRHRVLKKNFVVSSDRRNRITEDSESSAKWALSRCKECT
jgi:hypothetical protein